MLRTVIETKKIRQYLYLGKKKMYLRYKSISYGKRQCYTFKEVAK